jgi:hypothetical protein
MTDSAITCIRLGEIRIHDTSMIDKIFELHLVVVNILKSLLKSKNPKTTHQ